MDVFAELMAEDAPQGPRRKIYSLWCRTCGRYVDMEDRFCPVCSTPVIRFRCNRCGYEWEPRNVNSIPKYCPGCKSRYWHSARVRGRARCRSPLSRSSPNPSAGTT